ncbi:TetR family transcriptional regulator [Azospirillum doebereinerae]|uniref:TetR family transcriptional regulator n=1 Tax=Azospirillum doebereinerae TaxID=92933 RepID=UPI001EE59C77|nr:TetR family transcriptional regulator [Azospirillum doebereinerae]MCG5238273.1 TetR family transcriptional regulator [Azospirillum doebereinerae]
MAEPTILTPERILEAAEDVLRRFGPAKATVVDVARALGVSHGSVYRHFPSKAALREAVLERWLDRVSSPLAVIANGAGPAPDRLRRWFDTLIAAKRVKVLDDPEMFATYSTLAADSREVVGKHVATLAAHLARIVADGVAQGVFAAENPEASGRALLDATARFHHPAHAAEWSDPTIATAFDGVWELVMRGLESGKD